MKSKIIPNEFKPIIDEILEEQLLNANRSYAESNKFIFDLIEDEIRKRPIEYLEELKSRWNWHNVFYENLLEPAYLELINCSLNELAPRQIEEFINIYRTSLLVDNVTMVTSCGIKKHLEYYLSKISLESEGIDLSDAAFMMLTPPVECFYVQYQIDHLTYIVLSNIDRTKAEEIKKYLLSKYHANDEVIFKSRFDRDFSSKLNSSVEELISIINSYKINKDYKIKHYYFMLEHPERKAFRDILIYDNVDEKLLAFQLIGISGFLFRKQMLNYLNESKVLENDGFIYGYPDEVVLESLEKLKQRNKLTMEKNIKPFVQRGPTCAVVCMLMVLEYYGIISKIDRNLETDYYEKYHSKHLIGTPFSAVAYHLGLNGLDVEIIHSESEIFTNNQNYIPNDVFGKGMEEYNGYLDLAREQGVSIRNGVNITCEFLREKLEENRMIILAGNSSEFLHAILLCGYSGNKFIVCDPLTGRKTLKTSGEISKYMSTDIGKWCVTVKAKALKKDILLGSLDDFLEVASEKLGLQQSKNKLVRNLKR